MLKRWYRNMLRYQEARAMNLVRVYHPDFYRSLNTER